MKNVVKVLGIIAIVAVIGFGFVSCDDDDSGGGVSTKGKVTITGLDSYDGKFVAGDGNSEGVYLTMAGGSPDKGAKISGGKVTLKVWEFSDNKYKNFAGSGQLSFRRIQIMDKETSGTVIAHLYGELTGTFTNGDGGTVSAAGKIVPQD